MQFLPVNKCSGEGVKADATPYISRLVNNGHRVGRNKAVHELIGGSVAFNQLAPVMNTTNWAFDHATGSASDGVITFTANATAGAVYQNVNRFDIQANHVVMAIVDVKLTTGTTGVVMRLQHNTTPYGYINVNTTNTTEWQRLTSLFKKTEIYTDMYMHIRDTRESDWDAIQVKNAQIIDLTAMFGTTVADALYNMGDSGVSKFRELFTNDYYAYQTAELLSVKPSAMVSGGVTYPLANTELRGLLSLVNGEWVYDGDIYPNSGQVTRKYEKRAYQSGDESLANAITDGTNTIVKLATPTTESVAPFSEFQDITENGTESFTDSRTVPMPVAHNTEYPYGTMYELVEEQIESVKYLVNVRYNETNDYIQVYYNGSWVDAVQANIQT